MMEMKPSCCWFILPLSLLLLGPLTFADPQHDRHPHGKAALPDMHHHNDRAPRRAGESSGTHAHPWWEPPPPEYASQRSMRWTDAAAIARGKPLYQTYCMVCHGKDGRGNGPAARGLPHPPADLTNHFHHKPGDGDAYLFWRVSEGGQVEPFKSMRSTMPSFKTALSEDQRWDVLAYVHRQFHGGFKPEMMPTTAQAMATSVTGEGNVIAVTPTSEQIVIDHDAIKGFMDAMIMGYNVNPPALLEGLNAGDRIRFTVDTQQKAIVEIEKLNK